MTNLDILITQFNNAQTKGQLKNFLNGLLTPKEIDELAQRIQIIKLLKKGIAQHQIAQHLGVGVATVTRGSKEIQQGNFETVQ